jgi:hypothetical protein
MDDRIEVKVDVRPNSDLDVYFWRHGQRFDEINFDGGTDEAKINGTYVTESVTAWARLVIHQTNRMENGKTVWDVYYRTNVVGDEICVALDRVKKAIEQSIEGGISSSKDLTEDIRIPGWNIEIP